jgi:hypothetical protein
MHRHQTWHAGSPERWKMFLYIVVQNPISRKGKILPPSPKMSNPWVNRRSDVLREPSCLFYPFIYKNIPIGSPLHAEPFPAHRCPIASRYETARAWRERTYRDLSDCCLHWFVLYPQRCALGGTKPVPSSSRNIPFGPCVCAYHGKLGSN